MNIEPWTKHDGQTFNDDTRYPPGVMFWCGETFDSLRKVDVLSESFCGTDLARRWEKQHYLSGKLSDLSQMRGLSAACIVGEPTTGKHEIMERAGLLLANRKIPVLSDDSFRSFAHLQFSAFDELKSWRKTPADLARALYGSSLNHSWWVGSGIAPNSRLENNVGFLVTTHSALSSLSHVIVSANPTNGPKLLREIHKIGLLHAILDQDLVEFCHNITEQMYYDFMDTIAKMIYETCKQIAPDPSAPLTMPYYLITPQPTIFITGLPLKYVITHEGHNQLVGVSSSSRSLRQTPRPFEVTRVDDVNEALRIDRRNPKYADLPFWLPVELITMRLINALYHLSSGGLSRVINTKPSQNYREVSAEEVIFWSQEVANYYR